MHRMSNGGLKPNMNRFAAEIVSHGHRAHYSDAPVGSVASHGGPIPPPVAGTASRVRQCDGDVVTLVTGGQHVWGHSDQL